MKYASTAPATKRVTAKVTKQRVQRRSFLSRPGVMKPQICRSHTGEETTSPARKPTFRRSMNISNGDVAIRRHEPSEVRSARSSTGNEQYGRRMISPRGKMLPGAHWYHMNPSTVPTTTAAKEISTRRRSSCKCSTRDMDPSGLFRLRRLFFCGDAVDGEVTD